MVGAPTTPARQLECDVGGVCATRLAGLRWHHLSVHGRGMVLSVRRSRWKRRRTSTDGSNSGSDKEAGRDTIDDMSVPARRVHDSACAGAALKSDKIDGTAADTGSRADAAPVEQPECPLLSVEADAEPSFHGPGALEADERGGYDESANRVLKELLQLTRTDRIIESGRRIPVNIFPSAYDCASLATNLRAVFVSLKDCERATRIIEGRICARPGLFNMTRLRAMMFFFVSAFPRKLMCVCDQPEERAVLGLTSGRCAHPCSNFHVHLSVLGAPAAFCARDGAVIAALEREIEGFRCRRDWQMYQRRVALEAVDSSTSVPPALACMAGLSNPP